MTLKTPTKWEAPSGTGFFNPSNGGAITTLSGSSLTTLSGSVLVIDAQVYSPKHSTAWAKTGKNDTHWMPPSGEGYVVNQKGVNLADNLGNLLTDNLGNFLIVNPTYTTPKNLTAWTESGA
jgi:hypothetical protein